MKKVSAYLLLSTSLLLSLSGILPAQSWDSIPGFNLENGTITRLESRADSLMILGGFILEGADTNVSMIVWDDLSVEPWGLHVGFPGFYCVSDFQGDTYFGGSMKNYAGIDSADKMVRYDGAQWHSLGQGICSNTGTVRDIEVYADQLVIGGVFTDVDCDSDTWWARMAAWDGENWNSMGGVYGTPGGPEELILYNDKLFVVGRFSEVTYDNTTTNTLDASNIAWWDGNTWGEPMDGVSGSLYAAVVDSVSNTLYVGGYFFDASGTPCKHVAAWDGSQWTAVGDNLEGDVYSLCMYRGQLYAGGFMIEGDEWLAYYDGVEWHQVPGGNLDGPVKTMAVYQDELYIGGTFDWVGNMSVSGLARYYLHPDSVQWGVPDDIQVLELEQGEKVFVYPNPANEYIKISGEDSSLENSSFSLYNTAGQKLIYEEKIYRDMLVDISGLKAGSYTWEIVGGGEEVGSGVLVVW